MYTSKHAQHIHVTNRTDLTFCLVCNFFNRPKVLLYQIRFSGLNVHVLTYAVEPKCIQYMYMCRHLSHTRYMYIAINLQNNY